MGPGEKGTFAGKLYFLSFMHSFFTSLAVPSNKATKFNKIKSWQRRLDYVEEKISFSSRGTDACSCR
jgi:hypothetical protein